MRVVDRETFLSMPEGTVFAKYEPCIFGDLRIKGETWGNDFLAQEIVDAISCEGSSDFIEKLESSERSGQSLEMDFHCMGRDGLFEDEQLFAVWERQDIAALIARLQECIEEVKP